MQFKQEPTTFFRLINHESTSSRWKMWWQGSSRTRSPFTNSDKQMAHSTCVSHQGIGEWSWDVEGNGVLRSDEPNSRSLSCGSSVERSPCVVDPSCFSHPVPFQTRHGRLFTIISGARSRCAARAMRMRWMRSVTNVRQEGSIKMTINVNIGLHRWCWAVSYVREIETHEYHSQAEYWVVIKSERVRKPAWEVVDELIKRDNSL